MAAGLVALRGGQISSGIEKVSDLIDLITKYKKPFWSWSGKLQMDLQFFLGRHLSGGQTNTRKDTSACYLW